MAKPRNSFKQKNGLSKGRSFILLNKETAELFFQPCLQSVDYKKNDCFCVCLSAALHN